MLVTVSEWSGPSWALLFATVCLRSPIASSVRPMPRALVLPPVGTKLFQGVCRAVDVIVPVDASQIRIEPSVQLAASRRPSADHFSSKTKPLEISNLSSSSPVVGSQMRTVPIPAPEATRRSVGDQACAVISAVCSLASATL